MDDDRMTELTGMGAGSGAGDATSAFMAEFFKEVNSIKGNISMIEYVCSPFFSLFVSHALFTPSHELMMIILILMTENLLRILKPWVIKRSYRQRLLQIKVSKTLSVCVYPLQELIALTHILLIENSDNLNRIIKETNAKAQQSHKWLQTTKAKNDEMKKDPSAKTSELRIRQNMHGTLARKVCPLVSIPLGLCILH